MLKLLIGLAFLLPNQVFAQNTIEEIVVIGKRVCNGPADYACWMAEFQKGIDKNCTPGPDYDSYLCNDARGALADMQRTQLLQGDFNTRCLSQSAWATYSSAQQCADLKKQIDTANALVGAPIDLGACRDLNGDHATDSALECHLSPEAIASFDRQQTGQDGAHENTGNCAANETWDENALGCVANEPATQDDRQNQPQDLSAEVANAQAELGACLAAQKKANQCCTAPESCLGEAMGMGGSDSGMALQMIQTVMGGMAMSAQAAGSIGAMCGKMKTISYGAALMNAALGAACQKNVSQCQSTCSGAQSRVAALEQQLQAQQQQMSQAVGTATANLQAQSNANQAQLNSVKEIARSSERAITACATYDNQVQRSAQAAMASMMAAQMASDCKKQATASTSTQTESITANDFAVNCSTAGAASNPVCQQQCSRPGAENDPVCKAILAQLNGQQNTGGLAVTDPSAAGTGTPSGFDIGDPDEDAQLANPQTTPTDGASLASVQGGTGGLSGGLGVSPGGDDGAGMGGAPGAASLDNKLIRGFSSGTGYSTGGLRSGGGGFGGYGGYGRQPASTGKKFKLTDFLPGGKHAPKRHPTGFGATGSAHPEIGPASANIFQMISNRYYLLCKQDYIADCESLKKRGCPINALGGEACPD